MKRIILTIGLALLLVPSFANAKTFPHRKAGVQITIPDSWDTRGDDDSLACKPKDDSLAMFFVVVSAKRAEQAVKEMERIVSKEVKDLKMGKESEAKINGMDALFIDGKGKGGGHPVDVSAMLLHTPTGNFVLGFAVGHTGKHEKHDRAVMGILKSLKPIAAKKAKALKKGKR